MVGDTEFSDVRFSGDQERKGAVYRGVDYLTPADVADCILFAVTRPDYMVVDEMVIKPLAAGEPGLHRPPRSGPARFSRARRSASATSAETSAAHASGLFAHDTRFLSRCDRSRSTASGRCCSPRARSSTSRPRSTSGTRSPAASPQDALSIVRERFVGDGMQEHDRIQNQTHGAASSSSVALEVGADFADIISVKEHDFALGDPDHAPPLPPRRRRAASTRDGNQFVVRSATGRQRLHAGPLLASRARVDGQLDHASPSTLEPHETWDAPRRRHPVRSTATSSRRATRERRFGEERVARPRRRSRRGTLRVPQLRASWDELRRTFGSRSPTSPSLRMRRRRRSRPASRRGDALVHDRLRPRHAHHVPADAALRAGARAQRARRARRAAGERGRPGDRRRARQDRP